MFQRSLSAIGNAALSVVSYLKARLEESSTWLGVVAAATGAAALSPPWSYVAMVAGTIAVLVPHRQKDGAA